MIFVEFSFVKKEKTLCYITRCLENNKDMKGNGIKCEKYWMKGYYLRYLGEKKATHVSHTMGKKAKSSGGNSGPASLESSGRHKT
jgi:hypothetical protein